MEDDKLAAYYDELTRKGGGAARFKQGLGFSSTASSSNDAVPSRGSALPTTSSFLSSFVRASSPSKTSEFEKQAQLQSIQNKLSKKSKEKARSRSPTRNSGRRSRSRSRSPSRDRSGDKHSRRRSRSRSQSRDRYSRLRSRSRDRRSRRRSSRSREHESRRKNRSRSRSRSRERNRERSKRQGSPEGRRSEKSKKGGGDGGGVDFAKLIEGYDNMTPAERVKAKMKLQLSKTAENDETIGKGSGWERFDFDKDAPLDDEEIEAAEDDAALVKHMGQSFRFSAVEAKREEKIKAAHDEAIFGGSSHPPPAETEEEAGEGNHKIQVIESTPAASLLSDQVLTMQRGSWRNRARKP